MALAPKKKLETKKILPPEDRLSGYIKKGAPNPLITWAILGGEQFLLQEPTSIYDFVQVSKKGITKKSLIELQEIMDIPMKDMADLLNLSYKTLGRKGPEDLLDPLTSSLSIDIAQTIAKGLSVFEEVPKMNRWLQKNNRALQGKKPIELLNNPIGINLVNKVLGRIQEGIYT